MLDLKYLQCFVTPSDDVIISRLLPPVLEKSLVDVVVFVVICVVYQAAVVVVEGLKSRPVLVVVFKPKLINSYTALFLRSALFPSFHSLLITLASYVVFPHPPTEKTFLFETVLMFWSLPSSPLPPAGIPTPWEMLLVLPISSLKMYFLLKKGTIFYPALITVSLFPLPLLIGP